MSFKNVEGTLEFFFIRKFIKEKYPWIKELEVSEVNSKQKPSGKIIFHYLVDVTISGVEFLNDTDSKLVKDFFRLTEFDALLCEFSTISCSEAQKICDNIEYEIEKIVNNTHIKKRYDDKFRPVDSRKYILNDDFKVILPNINDIDDNLLE